MKINFDKLNGLVPAIIQDNATNKVLMLGFMNQEALEKTQSSGQVTFYSRTKKRLWTKGETSGNFLNVTEIIPDCDDDTLLIKVKPQGPACHTGADTCFNEENRESSFLFELEKVIQKRKTASADASYTAQLFQKGVKKIAQKVGEEATETILEAMDNNKELFKEESADLLYHLLVLMAAQNLKLSDTIEVLEKRHKK
ncbi:MAG: bifunctional phosphoribosyl-AMP cyclohydrolase/phosphoribosyl-ATP diphosphatase HisIE [Calditrichaeota bacterium]|nr:bifunctional phosphoribosyl-AMP cyclohydrolase/phosphoribosyl-ATP diphosphatase HisIE [Calditrichota bacterium]